MVIKTKTGKALEYLKKQGSMTSLDAYRLCKSLRFSAIVFNLRKKYIITDKWQPNSNGKGHHKVYFYGGERNVKSNEE